MSFFAKFPTIYYAIKDSENPQLLTNVVRRIALKKEVLDVAAFFADYTVKDGETPEIIADKLYDNPGLHWLVLLANEIVDPYSDWVMSALEFDKYLAKKYVGYTLYIDGNDPLLDGLRASSLFVAEKTIDTDPISTVVSFNSTYNSIIVAASSDNILVDGGDHLLSPNQNFSIAKIVPTLYALHHFEINGVVADPNFDATTVNDIRQSTSTPGSRLIDLYRAGSTTYAVSNYDYETKKNEAKRKIKLLRPEYVQVVLNELQNALTGNL